MIRFISKFSLYFMYSASPNVWCHTLVDQTFHHWFFVVVKIKVFFASCVLLSFSTQEAVLPFSWFLSCFSKGFFLRVCLPWSKANELSEFSCVVGMFELFYRDQQTFKDYMHVLRCVIYTLNFFVNVLLDQLDLI